MSDRTLYRWFADSVERYPDAPAVETSGTSLTYRELHRCSLAVASRIVRSHGGVPARVALVATRSIVAFAGYLAVQRLGAAVIPLNPGHPVRRNRTICELAGVDVVLADDSGAAQLDDLSRDLAVTRLSLGAAEALSMERVGSLPAHDATLDDIAYILFTSGSTGSPKGVPIRHRNLSPYVAHNIARYHVGPGCRMSHTFDLTFDPSVFDLFVTWGGGATLVVPQRAELLMPVDYLVNGRITHWFSVPSVVSVAADLGSLLGGLVTTLRYSVFIGEQLTYPQAHAWRAVAPGAVIDNVYGPTELTVACTEYRLPHESERWPVTSNDTVPIGPVYDFLDSLVLDDNKWPAGEGELCVRGPQRFDGYLNGAENRGRFLTHEGEIASEYDGNADLTDAHYYRTGDHVRFESGHLVHLGRLDNQVKIRGYRVELGEIEAVMRRHPSVGQTVVVAANRTGDTELTGYYTGTPIPSADLLRWLRKRLPIHMVPRRFNYLESMPLNSNGKIDRGQLRDRLSVAGASGFR
jgi:amino acid adenylation domain-containing protein